MTGPNSEIAVLAEELIIPKKGQNDTKLVTFKFFSHRYHSKNTSAALAMKIKSSTEGLQMAGPNSEIVVPAEELIIPKKVQNDTKPVF